MDVFRPIVAFHTVTDTSNIVVYLKLNPNLTHRCRHILL